MTMIRKGHNAEFVLKHGGDGKVGAHAERHGSDQDYQVVFTLTLRQRGRVRASRVDLTREEVAALIGFFNSVDVDAKTGEPKIV